MYKKNSTWERIGRGHTDEFSHWELFAGEEIYKRILELRRQLEDHKWGARLNQGDGDLIFGMIKDLEAVANSLYLARKELVKAQKQEPPAEKILKDLLMHYRPTFFYRTNKVGNECSFCEAIFTNSGIGTKEWSDTGNHEDGCPLPGALKWLEEMNEQD